jgi:hypothetical protein
MVSELAGMGRLIQKDERNHPMPLIATTVRRRMWSAGEVLDQGDTPQCVGYAGWGWLESGPIVNKPKFSPTDLYHMAQDNDEWPGRDYDGSSTLGLMKALKIAGYVKSYVWATDAETLVAWILSTGPVLVGTNWLRDMFTPDHFGFIEAIGVVDGGHEWRIIGADRDKTCYDGSKGAVRMVNSWGRNWGDNGRAWVSFADLDKLIKAEGEAATATEIKF